MTKKEPGSAERVWAHDLALALYPGYTPEQTGWLLVEHAERVILNRLAALRAARQSPPPSEALSRGKEVGRG